MAKRHLRGLLHAVSIGAGLSVPLGCFTAHATTVPLAQLLGTTINIAGADFTFVTYTSEGGAPGTSAVEVTYPPTGTTVPGFTVTGSFSALAGASQDAELAYTVTAPGITDVEAEGNPTSLGTGSGTGLASAVDTIFSGTSVLGPELGDIAISSTTPPGPGPASLTFAPTSSITIVEAIDAIGGSAGVHFTFLTSAVSQAATPLPAAFPLFATGLGALGLLWRVKRNASLLGAA